MLNALYCILGAPTFRFGGAPTRGETSSSFQGGNFHETSFDDVIVLIQPWYNFSQTVTYNNNNVFLPADTKSVAYKHAHSAQRWLIKKQRSTTALEAESPVSSKIFDFTPYAYAQSNILHVKYAEKTDDWGIGLGVLSVPD